jgi:hypothetical protein
MWPILASKSFLGLLALLGAAHVNAPPEEVQVTVVAILASDQHKVVDKKVEDIAKAVGKQYPDLTGFKLGVMTCKPVKVNTKDKFPLTENESATIVVIHAANKDNKVRLTIKAPEVGEVTYTSCCGKFFPLMTGYKTKKGERLLVAVMVEPCKEK